MEPFIAEQEERISNTSNRNGAQGKSYALMMVMMVVVMLIISGALVAMLFFQKQSFDALQANFQTLQSKLENPEAVSDSADDPAPVEEAPKKIQTLDEIPDTAILERKISSLEKTLGTLRTDINAVDKKVASGASSGSVSADTRALSSSISKVEKGLDALRRDFLAMKLSFSELEDNSRAWQADADRRLNSTEQAIMSLNDFRRRSSSNTGSADAQSLSRIYRELELLKQQHPYLND